MYSDPTPVREASLRVLTHAAAACTVVGFLVIIWSLFDQSDSVLTRAVKAAVGDPDRQWGFSGLYLLLALPMGAVVVVFVRTILGWRTFGLFTPMLLALAYLQSGPILGPTISTSAILVGMAAAPVLKWLQLSRVAFLGALISIVVTALGTLAVNFEQLSLISAFPVVVTALVVERWWNAWESEGPRSALKMTCTTLLVALLIQTLVGLPQLRQTAITAPLLIPIASTILMVLFGRYKGLRLSELSRFRAAKGD